MTHSFHLTLSPVHTLSHTFSLSLSHTHLFLLTFPLSVTHSFTHPFANKQTHTLSLMHLLILTLFDTQFQTQHNHKRLHSVLILRTCTQTHMTHRALSYRRMSTGRLWLCCSSQKLRMKPRNSGAMALSFSCWQEEQNKVTLCDGRTSVDKSGVDCSGFSSVYVCACVTEPHPSH